MMILKRVHAVVDVELVQAAAKFSFGTFVTDYLSPAGNGTGKIC